MNSYEVHEAVMGQVCKEIEQIVENMKKAPSMTVQDLEKLDKLYHLKKSMLSCREMEEKEPEGFSGRRGRGMDGRYMSRDTEDMHQSYAEGYSRGYSEAMNMNRGGNSGHYPMPYPERNW